ncbi:kinase-like domain-containing protein [Mycena latifolia]|nr:kinase-like domain-containing protein [Mycena latifolia]
MDEPDAMEDFAAGYPETQEQRQPTPPPEERNPDLWGYLERYPGNRLVPQARYDLYKTQPVVTFGRDPRNTICIPSGIKMSGFQATLRWSGVENGVSQVTIEDNKSKNGTYVNATPVPLGMLRTLRHGAEISFALSQPPPPGNTTMQDIRFLYHDLASPKRGVLQVYQLQEELGSGQYGRVYKAFDAEGYVFAVKAISADTNMNHWNTQGGSLTLHEARVQREIEVMKALDHPNVCRLQTHFWNPDGSFDLVLEYVDRDLGKFIARHGGLSERMTKHLMMQLCKALAFIHSKDIVHRDLKPENILLTKDRPPILKIADFGLAKLVDKGRRLQTICGTPMYAAPELVLNIVHPIGYNERVDCYASGVVQYVWEDIPQMMGDRVINWDSLDQHSLGTDKEGYPIYLSTPGRHFIRRLLEYNPETRMTMSEALEHEWLRFDQADAYPTQPTDLCKAAADSSDTTPNASRNATVTPANYTSRPQAADVVAPGPSLESKGDELVHANQSQQLAANADLRGAEVCAAGPGRANKRKHSALTPPAEDHDTGSARNTPLYSLQPSPEPEPSAKKGRNVDPDEMVVSPRKKKLVRRVTVAR